MQSIDLKQPALSRRLRKEPVFPSRVLAGAADPMILRRANGCACGGGCPRCRLPVSQPGDAKENEAEQMASQIMRMSAAAMPINRIPTVSATSSQDISGQPLDETTRAFFEPRFGRDLSRVRVHRDAEAAASAQAVGAQAYTINQSIVFGEGRFSTQTTEGKHLLAHELAHTVQQPPDGAAKIMRQPAQLSGVGASTQSDFGVLLHEMEVAALDSAPANSADAAIWQRYNSMFDDAQAFASELSAWVRRNLDTPFAIASPAGSTSQVTFRQFVPRAAHEIHALLRAGRAPGLLQTRARRAHRQARRDNPFARFENSWQGNWRQGGTTTPYHHSWQTTVPSDTGSNISVQPVWIAPVGRGGGVSSQQAAINAVNEDSGVITGAVGVTGGHAQRPHIGFYPGPGRLLWVAREGGSEGVNTNGTTNYRTGTINYSLFYEIVGDDGSYTILGLDFSWTRNGSGGGALGSVTTKGGQYRSRPSIP